MVSVVLFCVQLFWWFSHKPSEKNWAISPKAKHKISEKTLSTFQKCLFEQVSAFFFGCNQRKLFWELPQISLLGTIRVFCSNAESRFGWASFRWLRLVLLVFFISRLRCLGISNSYKNSFWFFGNVVSVVLYSVQLLWWFSHKPSEKFWAISPKTNAKIPKRRWVRSKFVFLNAALLFSLVVTNENCFKKLLRSLYLEQYGFFDQMQTHVSAGLVFDGYVWYFCSLHLASEMPWDIEFL